MVKKLKIFILPILLVLAISASATPDYEPIETTTSVGEQFEAIPTTSPSQETEYVLESELTREMIRAQKAHNAKEYDSFGGGITLISMSIVIGALIVLCILFYFFGKISSWFLNHKKRQTAKAIKNEAIAATADQSPDPGEVIAAISVALAQHFATDHDMQDTILTIRSMRKAYSPWNSKIYNMRHQPTVSHVQKPIARK